MIAVIETPVGPLTVAAEGGKVTRVGFGIGRGSKYDRPGDEATRRVLAKAVKELGEYFAGSLQHFSVPIAVSGSDFNKKVWDRLNRIDYGQTRTYGQIAKELGTPRAARAVGRGCSDNPLAIIIPCHRVLGAHGLGGYGGGLDAKRWLLRHEGVSL